MISLLGLDPTTLTLWLNPGPIETRDKPTIQPLLAAAYRADYAGVRSTILSAGNNTINLSYLASCVWHEQRHFLDLILTNYGAYRMRHAFNGHCLAALVKLKYFGEGVLAPVDLYRDPVVCDQFKILPVSTDGPIDRLLRQRAQFKSTFAEDNQAIRGHLGDVEFGGEAQLEGLAYLTQFGVTEAVLPPMLAQWAQYLNKPGMKYTWITLLCKSLGIHPEGEAHGSLAFMNLTFLIPVLMAGLMCRSYGRHRESVRSLIPVNRLHYLVEEWDKGLFSAKPPAALDVWEYVNRLSRRLWGCSVVDELKHDHELEHEYVTKNLSGGVDQFELVRECHLDYHKLRARVIQWFCDDPESFFDPRKFSDKVLPAMRPIVVVARLHPAPAATREGDHIQSFALDEPGGVFGGQPFSQMIAPRDWDTRIAARGSLIRGSLMRMLQHDVAMDRRADWIELIQHLAPIAKLITNGRRHRLMIGAEIEWAAERLRQLDGVTLVFHPSFLGPRENLAATRDIVLKFDGRKTILCDICDAQVFSEESAWLSPWFKRISPSVRDNWMRMMRAGLRDQLSDVPDGFFIANWSYQRICPNCFCELTSSDEGKEAYLKTGGVVSDFDQFRSDG